MKNILILTLGLFAITAFGQKSEKVELNWKINSGETLKYQTVMAEIDTSTVKVNFGELFDTLSDSTESVDKAQKMFEELNKSFQNIDFVTNLTNKKNGIIDIVMEIRPKEDVEKVKTDTLDDKIAEMIQVMSQGVMLRGSVYETGGIHSFWIKSSQKNLISLFFELPKSPVKIGDTWALEINFIANDQHFECDSAYQVNQVTLIDLKTENSETIAVLKYEIIEYVDGTLNLLSFMDKEEPTKTMMKFTHQAIALFSIEKGRWVSYDGVLEVEITGFMTSHVKKKFALIEE